MTIFFKIGETASEIITNMKKLAKESQFINGMAFETSLDYPNTLWIVDENFGNISGGSATVIITGDNSFKIDTALSGFTYHFTGNEVTYKGAYRGFLQQSLLPSFTPIITGEEQVVTSLSKGVMTLLEYAKLQEEFVLLKHRHGTMLHHHAHPWHVNCLLELIADAEQNLAKQSAEHSG